MTVVMTALLLGRRGRLPGRVVHVPHAALGPHLASPAQTSLPSASSVGILQVFILLKVFPTSLNIGQGSDADLEWGGEWVPG